MPPSPHEDPPAQALDNRARPVPDGASSPPRHPTPTSVALATDLCFRELGLHRMEICIRPENHSSLRVVQKLGFRYEGLRRRYPADWVVERTETTTSQVGTWWLARKYPSALVICRRLAHQPASAKAMA